MIHSCLAPVRCSPCAGFPTRVYTDGLVADRNPFVLEPTAAPSWSCVPAFIAGLEPCLRVLKPEFSPASHRRKKPKLSVQPARPLPPPTPQAILINSANLMGGSSEPDGFRGFGRVHLEAGVPLNGSGYSGLFVVDSNDTSISQDSVEDYTFELSGDKDVEFRATLAWIDPAASTLSSAQLVHDLDLTVISPSGVSFTMWSTGVDSSNVVERVIVSADDVAAEGNGTWTVSVSANVLSTESQAYSLVVSGPFGKGTAIVEDEEESSSAVASRGRGRGTGAWFSMSMSLLARAGVVLASGLVAGALLA